jgi:hypothetical protein
VSRYSKIGNLDDPHGVDGDPFFAGLDQLTEPSMLPAGTYQVGENIRIENGIAKSRGGLKVIPLKNTGSPTLGGKPKSLVKFSNPQSSALLHVGVDVPNGTGTVELKVVAKSGGSIVWNNQDFIYGTSMPDEKMVMEVNSNLITIELPTFPLEYFSTYPDLEFEVYLCKYTSVPLLKEEWEPVLQDGADASLFSGDTNPYLVMGTFPYLEYQFDGDYISAAAEAGELKFVYHRNDDLHQEMENHRLNRYIPYRYHDPEYNAVGAVPWEDVSVHQAAAFQSMMHLDLERGYDFVYCWLEELHPGIYNWGYDSDGNYVGSAGGPFLEHNYVVDLRNYPNIYTDTYEDRRRNGVWVQTLRNEAGTEVKIDFWYVPGNYYIEAVKNPDFGTDVYQYEFYWYKIRSRTNGALVRDLGAASSVIDAYNAVAELTAARDMIILEATPLATPLITTHTDNNITAVENTDGFKIPTVTAYAGTDEDVIVVMSDRISGINTDQAADIIEEPYNPEVQVTGIQAFDNLFLFSEGKRPKLWGGRSDTVELFPENPPAGADWGCPKAPFGYYISNRLVTPYFEDSATTISFSNVFESNLFLEINTYYCNKGTSDRVLGFQQYAENQLLVFLRNSIHIINSTHTLGTVSTNFEITRQYGVAGHKSFAQSGSYTYFLSSEGNIQVLVPTSDPAKGVGIAISKVTLDHEPLSKPIQPVIDQIDRRSLPLSIAHYHNNKVYFAVGIGKPYLNTILVYDTLRSNWISVDKFDFDINILDIESLNGKIYILTDKCVCEYETGSVDQSYDGSNTINYKIKSKFKTRDYTLNSPHIKKFVRGSTAVEVTNNYNLKINVNTKDPDILIESRDINTTAEFNAQSRFNISSRGYAANIEFIGESTDSSQEDGVYSSIKNTSVEAYDAGRTSGDFV